MTTHKTHNSNLSMSELSECGAHYGYSKSRRHPSMDEFVYASKGGVEIIDLEKTMVRLEAALSFARELGQRGHQILFVGAKAEAKKPVREAAARANQPFVTERWVGGMLTNFSEIKRRIARLEKLEDDAAKGEWDVYTKKEQLLLEREREKLETSFGGVRNLQATPGAVFIVDPTHESIATYEAQRRGIPIIGLMNLDCNATDIAYPVAANDSSVRTISAITEEITAAHQAGAAEHEKEEKAQSQ